MINVCTPKVCIPDEIILGSEIAPPPKPDPRPAERFMKTALGVLIVAGVAAVAGDIAWIALKIPNYWAYWANCVGQGVVFLISLDAVEKIHDGMIAKIAEEYSDQKSAYYEFQRTQNLPNVTPRSPGDPSP